MHQRPDEEVRTLKKRVDALEAKTAAIDTAFLKNDIGQPDYDAHRRSMKDEVAESERLSEYKHEATKKLIAAAILALGSLLSYGFAAYVRQLLGGAG